MVRVKPTKDIFFSAVPASFVEYLPAMAAACFCFVIYLMTMAPTAFPLDSAEMAAAAATLGLVHAPGYSVYLLLTHAFTHLPIGDIAFRVNLASAIFTSGAVGLLVLLLIRITRSKLVAVSAGLCFGFCFYVWSLSVVAEVYTLQALFLIIILIAIWRWREHGSINALLGAAFVMGLAFSNNPGTLLWWPGLLFLIFTSRFRYQIDRMSGAKLMAAFILGLLFLLYIPIRSAANPSINYIGQFDANGVFHKFDLTRLKNLFWYLTGRQFEWAFFAYSWPELVQETGRFFHRLWAAFLGIGLVIGLFGIWDLWRRNRKLVLGLILIALFHSLFFISYRVPDKDTMFLPIYVIWAIFLGIGFEMLRKMMPRFGTIVVLLLPLGLLITNYAYSDVSSLTDPRDIAEQRLIESEPNAFYLAVWGDAAVLEYLQVTEGLRSDVTVINILMIHPATRQELVKGALLEGRAVYSSFPDPALREEFRLVPLEHGFQITG